MTLAEGTVYRANATTYSYYSIGTQTYAVPMPTQPTSGWCYFRIDTTRPQAPDIAGGSPFTECTSDACVASAPVGQQATFTLTRNASDATVIGYKWRLVSESGSSSTTTVSSSAASVNIAVKPMTSELNRLEAWTYDALGDGAPSAYEFKVKAIAAAGVWNFSNSATPGTDSVSSPGTAHPFMLYNTAAYSDLGRGGVAPDGTVDGALALTDTSSSYAQTATAPINTSQSFTVSAWVYLESAAHNATVASQTNYDATAAGYHLYYSSAYKQWIFNWHYNDSSGAFQATRAIAPVTNPPVKVWTHLAGVYDASSKTLSIYVNGSKATTTAAMSGAAIPVATTKGMVIGRTNITNTGTYIDYLPGRVDEVKVWQAALAPSEILLESSATDTENGLHDIALVGNWDATAVADAGVIKDVSDYARPSLTNTTGAVVNDGWLTLNGTTGAASAAGPFMDDSGSFTVAADARITPAIMSTPIGTKSRIFGQRISGSAGGSAWAVWFERRGATGVWVFGRANATGTLVLAESDPIDAFTTGEDARSVAIVAAFDAQAAKGVGQVAIWVNLVDPDCDVAGSASCRTGIDAGAPGSGDMVIGRSATGATTFGEYYNGSVQRVRLWTGGVSRELVEYL